MVKASESRVRRSAIKPVSASIRAGSKFCGAFQSKKTRPEGRALKQTTNKLIDEQQLAVFRHGP